MPAPRRNAAASSARPSAQDIFTDRVDEQRHLADFFSALCAKPYTAPAKPVLSFYGVGGIGKSTLLERAIKTRQKLESEIRPEVALAFAVCNIDLDEFRPDYPPMQFYGGTLRPALLRAGMKRPLFFDLLYLAWWGKANPNCPLHLESPIVGLVGRAGAVSETLGECAEALGSIASGFKAGDLALKAVGFLKKKLDERRYREVFGHEREELTQQQLERLAPRVLAEDLVRQLDETRNKALCVVIDSFERIQSEQHGRPIRHDLQESVQELFSQILSNREPRVGFVIFGRERLDWRRLYDDPYDSDCHWDHYIDSHLLEALAENDARSFLGSVVDWCDRHIESGDLGGRVKAHTEAILESSNEVPGKSQRQFHPYSLDLAIAQIAEKGHAFQPYMLGRGSKDLQERFLRYMNEGQRKAFQVLALALEFDNELFHHLVTVDRIAGCAQQDFHDLVGRDRSYLREDTARGGRYHFHEKMRQALLASLSTDFGQNQRSAIREIVTAIFDFHHHRLRQALSAPHNWAEAAQHYDRAALLLATHAKEGRLEGPTLVACVQRLDEGLDSTFNLGSRIQAWLLALRIQKEVLGNAHPDVAANLQKLARLQRQGGHYADARDLYEQALVLQEAVLGPEHPRTAGTLNELADLLCEMGDATVGGRLCGRAVAILEDAFGPEHPDTAAALHTMARLVCQRTVNQLADLLCVVDHATLGKGLCGRAVAILEDAFGPEHPDTAAALHTMARLVSQRVSKRPFVEGRVGHKHPACMLFERALAIRERVDGPDHPNTVACLFELASLLCETGEYAAARPLHERALALRELRHGREHPDTLASGAHDLFGIPDVVGPPVVSERRLFDRALAICEAELGPEHPRTIQSLDNLSSFLGSHAQYSTALALSERSLTIRGNTLGPEHPAVALSLRDHANLLVASGEVAAAQPLYERARCILEAAFIRGATTAEQNRHETLTVCEPALDTQHRRSVVRLNMRSALARHHEADIFSLSSAHQGALAVVFGRGGFSLTAATWKRFSDSAPRFKFLTDPFFDAPRQPHRASKTLWLWFVPDHLGTTDALTDDQLVCELGAVLYWAASNGLTMMITNGSRDTTSTRAGSDRRARFLIEYAIEKEQQTGLTILLVNMSDVFIRNSPAVDEPGLGRQALHVQTHSRQGDDGSDACVVVA